MASYTDFENISSRYDSLLEAMCGLSVMLIFLWFISYFGISPKGIEYTTRTEWKLLIFFIGISFLTAIGSLIFSREKPYKFIWINIILGLGKEIVGLKAKGRAVVIFFALYLVSLTLLLILDGGHASPFSHFLILTASFGTYLSIYKRTKGIVYLFVIGSYLATSMIFMDRIFDQSGKVASASLIRDFSLDRIPWLELMIVTFIILVTLYIEYDQEDKPRLY